MKKKLYFTNNAGPMKEMNSINTYVNFVYDTKTGELKLVDCFGGEVKEVVVATIDKAAPEGPEFAFTKTTTGEGDEAVTTYTVEVTFAEDAVKKEFSLDGKTFEDYTEPIVIEEDGTTITFRSTDEKNNAATVKKTFNFADAEEA